jgi:hypothetical protein
MAGLRSGREDRVRLLTLFTDTARHELPSDMRGVKQRRALQQPMTVLPPELLPQGERVWHKGAQQGQVAHMA